MNGTNKELLELMDQQEVQLASDQEQGQNYAQSLEKPGWSHLIDLGESANQVTTGNRHTNVVGQDFYGSPWDLGNDPDNDVADRRHTGRFYRPRQPVADMVDAGHGFRVVQLSNPDLPTQCKYCGDDLPLREAEFPCEFAHLPMSGCRCNGCRLREMKLRNRGRQPVQCGKPECKKSLKRDQKRKERARGKAKVSL